MSKKAYATPKGKERGLELEATCKRQYQKEGSEFSDDGNQKDTFSL